MIRILHIVTYMGRGGLETLLMNCFRHIDREQVQFDFLVHREFRADYDDEIEALGGKIFRLPRLNPISPGYYKALTAFFQEHPEYLIVHCHLDCMSAIPLSVAKKSGVPVRIAHSHNANQDRDLKYPLKLFFRGFIPKYATHLFACSEKAGKWMFSGQNFTVIRNGIDTECYRFQPDVRTSLRKEIHFGNSLVIGHTGRFMPQKNHTFLIEIFSEVHKLRPDSLLLLIGDGPLKESIQKKVNDLQLSDAVRFLGVRSDVDQLLQAMDVFVMPSLYEGFGIAALEAQASGLPCILSDVIPDDCIISNELVSSLSLSTPAQEWAEYILSHQPDSRTDHSKLLAEKGYDIMETVRWLTSFYLNTGASSHD